MGMDKALSTQRFSSCDPRQSTSASGAKTNPNLRPLRLDEASHPPALAVNDPAQTASPAVPLGEPLAVRSLDAGDQ
jgi:hypothetical protein